MRLLLICPVPAEFGACRETLLLRDLPGTPGCRAARGIIGGTEILAIESGPAKARAAAATAAACLQSSPDLVVDSGACCGLEPGLPYGQIILADACLEFDIGGDKLPERMLPEMRLAGGLSCMDAQERETLQRTAVERAREHGAPLRIGVQACGELLIRSLASRQYLFELLHATGANWETAGVFVAALRAGVPALSLRIVTDLGDDRALQDFHRNVRGAARRLYGCLGALAETGWFSAFGGWWAAAGAEARARLSAAVQP